ncbi:biliverdin-producing heme oxygenase [Aspergillus affinis]|uniref:biliverdin-producing heme oxygenase n=1 Tax=Aspergillus affinis TaxID=1070780 RepID=UPI0022FE9AC2|nr:heme-binding peroxidase [Aspergillus affinis]KAI9042158.1 heme-binding peroxidase [Aspergillus affinis]
MSATLSSRPNPSNGHLTMTDITARIKEATRVPHGEVNHMNTDRIRKCLTGEKKSLVAYAVGFSFYAEIYLGLEEAWREIDASAPSDSESSEDTGVSAYQNKIWQLSELIRMDSLNRTERLQADLACLRSLDPAIARLTDRELNNTHIREDVRSRIREKPHRLLAYAWVLYQALFNGGRFIRRQLIKAGPKFWGLPEEDDEGLASFPPPLSFWHVPDDPNYPQEFRCRVKEAEGLLTTAETDDVIEESVGIICRCKALTEELDKRGAGFP